MSLSENLFKLVKSLSAHEKGYFKKHTLKAGSTDKKYLTLFNVFEQATVYNAKDITKQLAKEGLKGNLANTKRYLLEMITKSLIDYQTKNSTILEILYNRQAAEVMMNKKLYNLSKEFLDKAEQIAIDNALFNEQLIIANVRYRIAIRTGDYEFLESTASIYKNEVIKLIDGLNNLWQLIIAQSQAVTFSAKIGNSTIAEAKEYFKESMSLPIFEEAQKLDIATHEIFRLNILSTYSKQIKDNSKAYEYAKQAVLIYQEYPTEIKRIPRNYMTSLITLANRSMRIERYTEVEHVIGELISFRDGDSFKLTPALQIEISSYVLELQLQHMHYTRSFSKAPELYNAITEFVKEHRQSLKKENIVLYYYFLAHGFYRHGDNKRSNELIRQLLDENRGNTREDLMISAHLLLFIIQLDNEQDELLPYTLNNIKYYVKKAKPKIDSVNPIITFFGKLIKVARDKKETQQLCKHFINDIRQLKTTDPEDVALINFDFEWWLNNHC